MAFSANHIPVAKTRSFTSIVEDYLAGDEVLKQFYQHAPDAGGVAEAIKDREAFKFDRKLLCEQLDKQYSQVETAPVVQGNLSQLRLENTFTVCTAHQPNIFTGHLYFVYKILHTISLARHLSKAFPGKNFVPVFYIGSEDADLDELGAVEIGGKKYRWNTDQKGAVGRMVVDKKLVDLVDEVSNQVSVLPHGKEIVALLRESYKPGRTIEESTFHLVNAMFGRFGLIVLMPDNKAFKYSFKSILEKELTEGFSAQAVEQTISKLPAKYKVQAGGREINLFYLQDQSRERIERKDNDFTIHNTSLVFSKDEMIREVTDHPERLSPNVILRPVFQEWILPNVAFIGGGGELAYWLELKEVFSAVKVPMPALVLRNSFLVIGKDHAKKLSKWDLSAEDLFKGKQDIIDRLVISTSASRLGLEEEKEKMKDSFASIKVVATEQDKTLEKHILSIQHQLMKKLGGVEKKMLRAARKREQVLVRQATHLHEALFPNGKLQERVENIIPYYAAWGASFIDALLEHSGSLEQEFTVLSEK